MRKYDVGIFGWWYNYNYGANITYYALNRAIQNLGKSVVMLWRSTDDPREPDTVQMKFAKRYYNISERLSYDKLPKYNDICDSFVLGSDQVWNPDLEKYTGDQFFLSFADKEHITLAYAQSFGEYKNIPDSFANKYIGLVKSLSKISMREDYAVNACQKAFGVLTEQVCDPVFLLKREQYNELINNAKINLPEHYVLNFFLNPNADKMNISKHIRKDLKISKSVNFTDLENPEKLESGFLGEPVELNSRIENLIKAYKNADYIVTDSFHGTCLAIIFNKPFISIANVNRGVGRFKSLLSWTNLSNRLIYTEADLDDKHLLQIDYLEVNKTINKAREDGIQWLKNGFSMKISKDAILRDFKNASVNALPANIEALYNNPDYRKIRILATLLRDYGIKHIVLSPGGRDVPLVRMFEYNEDQFVLHRITDERSAAYYGLGIAAQLQKPVACVCTSGTAASNYLPAVTEAFYTGVPLIMITADRRAVYLNHGEDQTIPQKHIYRDVIKQEITLPEAAGFYEEYQTRRDICACILESTHNGFGPVHINVTVDNISIGANVEKTYWKLLPRINPHMLRVCPSDGEAQMMRWVDSLKKSTKVLVVYGQNAQPTEKQLKTIEKFASHYNCAIVTDFISNLDCAYSLKPYNMLQKITQQEFNEHLSPDILISVGGKRLMNDPLTFKVRGGLGNIRHWSVTPDGNVKDFYFHLTSIIETSQDYFFEWFANHAGDCINNGVYYNIWKQYVDRYPDPVIEKYNSHYVQSKFIPAVPSNSLLHLGVGQSFFDSRRYTLDKSVSVFCNMGTNGIDGCTSTFMGQCSVVKDKLCFLLVGDLSFFYDMNSIWNKPLNKNIRILMVNNNGTDLLRGHNLKAIASVHNTEARGWVESTGFEYICARTKEEYEEKLRYFVSNEPQRALFFEVFC